MWRSTPNFDGYRQSAQNLKAAYAISDILSRETQTINDSYMGDLAERLPVMPDGERVILVETSNEWVPAFNVGFETTLLDNFNFTSPRFAPQLCWESC